MKNLRNTEGILLIIFAGCVTHSLWALSLGWNNTILDMHGFRQTQTAISVFYLLHGSPWLAYETPVLGAPWSIPFEFPIYHWLTALVVKIFGTPLDQTGRFVSVFFFYLSLIPSYIILNYLNISRHHRWIFLSLFLASPLYLFWSRTFMIESTALFLGLAYLASICSYFHKTTFKSVTLALAIFFGVLDAVVKVTTFWGFALAAIILTFVNWQKSNRKIFYNIAIPLVGFAVLPYVAVHAWTHFADSQKLLNPLAADFITSKALNGWNFGDFHQRLSGKLWKETILFRIIHDLFGKKLFVAFSLALIPFLGKRKNSYLASILIFLAVILTFTNLHIVHNYYTYANGIFLIAAMGFCILGLLEKEGILKLLGYAIFALCLVAQLQLNDYLHVASTNSTSLLATATEIQKHTGPDDVLVIYGYDWSSELPYYSQRRALMNWKMTPPDAPKMKAALEKVSKYHLGALVFCNKAKLDTDGKKHLTAAYHMQPDAIYTDSNCEVHL